ncbi:uncharacterized protein LOC144712053 [Wolffia australiana]
MGAGGDPSVTWVACTDSGWHEQSCWGQHIRWHSVGSSGKALWWHSRIVAWHSGGAVQRCHNGVMAGVGSGSTVMCDSNVLGGLSPTSRQFRETVRSPPPPSPPRFEPGRQLSQPSRSLRLSSPRRPSGQFPPVRGSLFRRQHRRQPPFPWSPARSASTAAVPAVLSQSRAHRRSSLDLPPACDSEAFCRCFALRLIVARAPGSTPARAQRPAANCIGVRLRAAECPAAAPLCTCGRSTPSGSATISRPAAARRRVLCNQPRPPCVARLPPRAATGGLARLRLLRRAPPVPGQRCQLTPCQSGSRNFFWRGLLTQLVHLTWAFSLLFDVDGAIPGIILELREGYNV